jgi:hypothetical protein
MAGWSFFLTLCRHLALVTIRADMPNELSHSAYTPSDTGA